MFARAAYLQLVLAVAPCYAATPAAGGEPDDVAAAAALIDEHVFSALEKAGIEPAAPSSDAEFLRRVWLDTAGRIPPVAQVRQFPADDDPHKRRRVVDSLLARSEYVEHFATFWRNVLMPEVKSDARVRQLLPGFDGWLRERLAKNTPYDELVREILNTPISARTRDPQFTERGGERSAIAFFQAKEVAPENLAAATSRIFLGIRLECAQCHNHPFDRWTQRQFWSFASFYAGIERNADDGVFGRVSEVFDRRELHIPDTEIVVQAAYLDGVEPQWRRGVTSRQTLADWVTAADNPYFARMAVNRIWGKFFGIGLIEPVDDFVVGHEGTHPELLAELTKRLVEHDFDLKFLIRAITASRAYQLSSEYGPGEVRLFAAMPVKGLTPEQLYDCLVQAVGHTDAATATTAMEGRPALRDEILELFANETDGATAQQTSVLQALALMNGSFVASAVDRQRSRTLVAANDPSLSTDKRVELLFASALSRPPTSDESRQFVDFVDSHSGGEARTQALSDVLWALLNSTEFATNH